MACVVLGKCRRFYCVYGDTVNTAARMMMYAKSDNICVSEVLQHFHCPSHHIRLCHETCYNSRLLGSQQAMFCHRSLCSIVMRIVPLFVSSVQPTIGRCTPIAQLALLTKELLRVSLLQDFARQSTSSVFSSRGIVNVKGKGEMNIFDVLIYPGTMTFHPLTP